MLKNQNFDQQNTSTLGGGVLELLLAGGTGIPGPVLNNKRWTSSPLQVLNFRGLVWTAGTVLGIIEDRIYLGVILVSQKVSEEVH